MKSLPICMLIWCYANMCVCVCVYVYGGEMCRQRQTERGVRRRKTPNKTLFKKLYYDG